MPDYTPYQRGIIRRYYEHRDDLTVQKLGELVSQLYVAESEKERDRLWKRVQAALTHAELPKAEVQRILERRDVAALAKALEKLF